MTTPPINAKTVKMQQANIEALQQQVDDLKLDLGARYQELAMLQKQIISGGGTAVGNATQEIAKRKKAEAQLEAIKKSKSWRVTAPMRKVMNKMRK